jgi:hypothetical protein
VLPADDLTALFGVVVTVAGELTADQLDRGLAQRLIERLAAGSEGELNARLGDLCRRLHWAMGADDTYPAPAPRTWTYLVRVPDSAVAAAVVAELAQAGGRCVVQDDGQVAATFPDLVPSMAYGNRVCFVEELARRHGGEYAGSVGP